MYDLRSSDFRNEKKSIELKNNSEVPQLKLFNDAG